MLHRLFAVLLLAAAGSIVPSVASAAACSGTAGVTVVVDFDNGSTRVGCAPGDPSSGYDALRKAGFTLTFATGNGLGALCSIDDVPSDPCTSMPPTSAYWAYFHASPGGSWAYSNSGGGSYNPKPGSVEGWHFKGSPSDPPGTAPPGTPSTQTPKPTPKPTPTAKPTTGATSTPTKGSTAAATAGGTPTAPDATAQVSGTPSPGATATATDVGASAAADGTNSDSVTFTAPEAKTDDSSGGLSWIWGLALVAVLAAAGGVTALRRRRS